MKFAMAWSRWMKRWRVERARRTVAPVDPADCGTAWGLELTVTPPAPKPQRQRPH